MDKLKTVSSLVFSAAVIIFVIFCPFILITSHNSGVAAKEEFDSASNCASASLTANATQPCTSEAVRVTYKVTRRHSRKHSEPHYVADLQSAAGEFSEVEVHKEFYDAISPANDMTATVWHGDIVSLTYQGKTDQTSKNPNILDADDGFSFLVVVVIGGAVILVFCFGLYFWIQWKSLTA